MKGYLGEFTTEVHKTKEEWALYFIESYGQIDGDHHKAWVLDQVARILNGTPVVCKEARWDNGYSELRESTGEPSQRYKDWVADMCGEECDGEYEYMYYEGTPP